MALVNESSVNCLKTYLEYTKDMFQLEALVKKAIEYKKTSSAILILESKIHDEMIINMKKEELQKYKSMPSV